MLRFFKNYAAQILSGVAASATLIICHVFGFYPEQYVAWGSLRLIANSRTFEAASIAAVFIFAAALVQLGISYERWKARRPEKRAVIETRNDPTDTMTRTSMDAPNWSIRDLFLHLCPNLSRDRNSELEAIGYDVLDKFSTGQLKVWGRQIDGSKRRPLAAIPSEHWQSARFTYWFLDDGNQQSLHVNCDPQSPGRAPRQYADLQVNRSEALRVWIGPLRETPQPMQVLVQEAAQIFYEAMEKAGVDDMVGTTYSSPDLILDHFKHVFLTEAGKEKIRLYGKRLPSRQSLFIPPEEIGGLTPVKGRSTYVSLSAASKKTFHDVTISGEELDRLIEERIAMLKRLALQI